MGNTPHVAIVGAGFGGLGVAEQLDHVPVEVTLIDSHNYHTFQPLLYQVATSLLNAEDVGAPVRGMFRHQDNVTFRMATVTGVDAAGQKIQLEDGKQIPYDYLVLAGGRLSTISTLRGQPSMRFHSTLSRMRSSFATGSWNDLKRPIATRL